jgi:hypothetical protein
MGVKIDKNENENEILLKIDEIKPKDLKFFSEFNKKIRKIYLIFKYKEKVLKVQKKIMDKKLNISKILMVEKNTGKGKDTVLKSDLAINVPEIKEYTPLVDTTKENPLLTKEKERERLLHQIILLNNMLNLSIDNYYELNSLLRAFILEDVYNHTYLYTISEKESMINLKKEALLNLWSESIRIKEDLASLDEIYNEINLAKKSAFIKNKEQEPLFEYIFDIFLKKNKQEFTVNDIEILLGNKEQNLDVLLKEENTNLKMKSDLVVKPIIGFLNMIKKIIEEKKILDNLSFFESSKKTIINRESIKDFKQTAVYIEKQDLEH